MAKTVALGSVVFGAGEARIAVPVLADSARDIEEQWAVAAQAGADLIEWRIDGMGTPDASVGRDLRVRFDVPVLATVRTSHEGGGFSGDITDYMELVLAAASWADAVDIEQDRPGSETLVVSAKERGALVVMSHHVFDRPIQIHEIEDRLQAMASGGADIAKIAWMTTADEVSLIQGEQQWAWENLSIPAVIIGMGEVGAATRLGDSARRSAFTFAVGARSSAPGQLSIAEVRASL